MFEGSVVRIEESWGDQQGRCQGFKGQRGGVSENPVTPPRPDSEHKHDMAMLAGEPDQIPGENNRLEAKECLRKKD